MGLGRPMGKSVGLDTTTRHLEVVYYLVFRLSISVVLEMTIMSAMSIF